ncbi:hypothetical protein PR202_ga06475 [Eleusine coracana subsp. coracana]|uniref:non-specific serine/threonine protein kinase n=1 Tax=Eleusine coracana subsp. coracana TaxID=191504 RepID=A0AAV5BW92_ELECO|nr:hypothetical protein PR202_ga06475 [Eleusine coracana subsp. coracana]
MKLYVAILLVCVLQYTSGQPDYRGFISIDCGIPENSSYQDLRSSMIYVSDYGFISSGANRNISPEYIKPSLAQRNYNVRFFPDGTRNCYTLRSLVAGNKYFVRADFYYGNYDGLNKLPVFDLYLGTSYWHEVMFNDASAVNWMDIIVVAPADYLQVCLVNKGMGTPFISGLDLRPLKSNLYPEANVSQSLVLINSNRFNMGPTDNLIVRYPLDPHDRIWSTYDTIPSWTEISATSLVENYLTDAYDAPSAVMQTAATPINGSRIDLLWDPSDPSVNISSRYFFVLYFAELQNVPSNALRQFDIIGLPRYSISLVATKSATLPPILNAMEVYLTKPISDIATDPGDATAMMAIQEHFNVKKNWMGDPCAPKAFSWIGLNCTYPSSSLSRVKALDLSHNNLSGPIPNSLEQLPLLVFLDLSNNDLSGPIPYNLLHKSQNGTLLLRVGNNGNLCGGSTACGSGKQKLQGPLVAAIIMPIVAVIALFVILVLLLQRTLKKKAEGTTNRRDETALLESREFSYRELKNITNNFSQEIGRGGFGAVFLGHLENGNPVAVKARSNSSSQGGKEFLAEVQHLTRIHHKNLVSLIGYCKDKNNLALVYEYVPEGNLEDHLRDTSNYKPLTWEQRLQIALDAAQGLEYLHVACKPALIHRDVKSRNILLTTNHGAKIADFGLTKAFSDSKTHITTEPAGTMGYLDPEYYRSYQISENSDVYSFGVVLLELITGHSPVVPINESVSIHIGEWVHQNLVQVTIESIIDSRMGGHYDINSIWKVADLALRCKQEVSRERPTMTDVVAQIKESIKLEIHRDGRRNMALGSVSDDLRYLGEKRELEIGHVGEISGAAAGPVLR